MDVDLLKGVRIVEVAEYIAGPAATMLLGYLGAEVIKVENIDKIQMRAVMSFMKADDDDDMNHLNFSTSFNEVNHNKKSIRLNLSHPKGAGLMKQLLAKSDVLLENMRPEVMDKLGLGYETLKKINPGLIMVSSSAFGSDGPYHNYGGYAWNFATFGGLAHLTGYADCPPNALTISSDNWNAYGAALAIMIALCAKQQTGKGQYIDFSQAEQMAMLGADALLEYDMTGNVRHRDTNLDTCMAPHNCYPCTGDDQWISIAVATDEEWKKFCKATEHPEWINDKRFADGYSRWENQIILDGMITEWTCTQNKVDVMKLLQANDVAAMPSFCNQEMKDNEYLKSRGLLQEADYGKGPGLAFGAPFRFGNESTEIRRAPKFGEHNREIFEGLLGLSPDDIAAMVDEKIIY